MFLYLNPLLSHYLLRLSLDILYTRIGVLVCSLLIHVLTSLFVNIVACFIKKNKYIIVNAVCGCNYTVMNLLTSFTQDVVLINASQFKTRAWGNECPVWKDV